MLKLKDLLKEAPIDPSAALSTVYGDNQKGGSPAIGQVKLSKIISDPKVQAVLNAGQEDGDPNDDKLPYSKKYIPVKDLQPTQKEIGFKQSVMNLLTDKWGSLKSFFAGKPNVGGPIVTYAGQYIIDGHHRWSQVFAANPRVKMLALDIKAKPGFKHTDILKAVHGAIAASLGKVPEADPEGINLLKGVALDQIPIKKLKPNVFKIWQDGSPVNVGKSGTMEINSPEDVQQAIFQNLEYMIEIGYAAGAPGRKHMPQSDAEGGDPIDHLGNLARGNINISEPFTERFQTLANIKKGK